MTEEDKIQFSVLELLRWAANEDTIFFAVPNGLPAKARTVHRFKKLGLRPGVADLCIVVRSLAHFMEIKTPEGRQSIQQKAFALQCEVAGVPYRIARSLDEAKVILQSWGALRGNVRLREAA